MKKFVIFCVVASVALAVPFGLQEMHGLSNDEPESSTFRLPNDTIPIHYDLHLRTLVRDNDFSYTGTVRIHIKVVQATQLITLHCGELDINSIDLLNINGSIIEANLSHTTIVAKNFIIIPIQTKLEVDQELIISFSIWSLLRNDFTGFHLATYSDPETFQMKSVATTNFNPLSARFTFPCYDEVKYRTTFDLQIEHHRSRNAVSNMPVMKLEENGNFITTIFHRTPQMPTYIFGFTVSEFEFISNNDESLPMKIYAQSRAIESGQADFSLAIGEKMLRTLEELSKVPYSHPKSDQIAIPQARDTVVR